MIDSIIGLREGRKIIRLGGDLLQSTTTIKRPFVLLLCNYTFAWKRERARTQLSAECLVVAKPNGCSSSHEKICMSL
jgi:hypothetical protein